MFNKRYGSIGIQIYRNTDIYMHGALFSDIPYIPSRYRGFPIYVKRDLSLYSSLYSGICVVAESVRFFRQNVRDI